MKFGALSQYHKEDQRVILDFEGTEAVVTAVTPKIINVYCGLGTKKIGSKAIEGDKRLPVELRTEEKTDGLWIHTGEVSVRVSSGFYVDFYDKEGREVCGDYRGKRKPLQRVSEEYLKLLESEGHSAVRQGREPA